MNVKEMANELQGSSAEACLLHLETSRPGLSFCRGSDRLVELGLWDEDGQMSDFARDVRDELVARMEEARLYECAT